MALKARITADELTALPEPLRTLYKGTDAGDFMLDAEGVEDVRGLKSALDKIKRDRDEMRATVDRFAGLDVEAAKEALDFKRKAEDKKLLDEGKVEELLQKRTEIMRRDYENALKAREQRMAELEQQAKSLEASYSEVVIDNGLKTAAIKHGVRDTAVDDVILRGKRVWRLKDNKPLPLRDDGTVIMGKKATEPLTMEEWLEGLKPDAPHLFEPNKGMGSKAATQAATGGEVVFRAPAAGEGPINLNDYLSAKEVAEKTGARLRVEQ
jgi:hypothetical protein